MNIWPFRIFPIGGTCVQQQPPAKPTRPYPTRIYGPWRSGMEVPTKVAVCQRVRVKTMTVFDKFDGECWLVGGPTFAEGLRATKRSAKQACKWREILHPEKISDKVKGDIP